MGIGPTWEGCIVKWIATLIILLVVCERALAAPPTYVGYQLQARANFSGAFNLPNATFFTNATPRLNSAGKVVIKIEVLNVTGSQAVWLGQNGSGGLVYTSPVDATISDASINNPGRAIFEQFFSSQDALFYYDSVTLTGGLATTLPLGATGWGSPAINDSGHAGYRARFSSNNAYVSWDGGTGTAVHAAEVALVPSSPYSFLFTPAFNNARQIAGKVRLGGPGQTGNSQPDEIRVFNMDGTSSLIAQDRDANVTSPYSAFDNSVALTNDGWVAFIANRFAGGRGVYLSNGATTLEIANTNTSPATNIEFFAPAVNNHKIVAFRAIENTGLRAVWVGDGSVLAKVVREHDLVPSDLGTARIDQNDASPTFGGSISINDCGDVAFNATLTPPGDNQIEWGSGLYIANASRARMGDMNCDCKLDIADLPPFVQALLDPAAYAVAFPACPAGNGDLNGDTVVNAADVAGFADLLVP
jgi:hypothetical protein